MIALSGICLAIIVGIIVVFVDMNSRRIPTDKEMKEIANKLNRMALDRNNTKGK